jgi:hypothetical protein
MSVKNVFCLLNCFQNYDICAGKIIEFYIQNAVRAIEPNMKVITNTYFETTPYLLYSIYGISSGYVPGANYSKQYQDFITILGLTAVTLARIESSDATVWANQGVVSLPGFATMFAMANEMNKTTVLWTDDLRNLWGTSNDPLMIGMTPTPYKYLWTSESEPGIQSEFKTQTKGLNGSLVVPNLGSDKNLCPQVSLPKFTNNWNTFVDALKISENAKAGNKAATLSTYTQGLIKIGHAIIEYVQTTKKTTRSTPTDTQTLGEMYGTGWVPSVNVTLWFDINAVIMANATKLNTSQQAFITANNVDLTAQAPPKPKKMVNLVYGANVTAKSTSLNTSQNSRDMSVRAMGAGMAAMLKPEANTSV